MRNRHLAGNLHFEKNGSEFRRFRTGVSLHSHTLHSREPLSFIYRYARTVAPLRWAVERGERRYRALHGKELDFSRAYWTPPISAHDAWALEARQIGTALGMQPLVSLTDHDNIDAAMTLRVLESFHDLPISVEWTVPYRNTFFHLGVHNLSLHKARRTMSELAAITAHPNEGAVAGMLESLAADPSVLVVFNHPCWDESEIGQEAHFDLAVEFYDRHNDWIHALELNGLRPWKENREVIALAEGLRAPLISGGDRHGLEPNATLNVTNAGTFAEFVGEVRDGVSEVVLMSQYCEPFSARILRGIQDAMADHRSHGHGWVRWSDRVFYVGDDGESRPVRQLWKNKPFAIRVFETGLYALRHPGMQIAFRAMAREEATQ